MVRDIRKCGSKCRTAIVVGAAACSLAGILSSSLGGPDLIGLLSIPALIVGLLDGVCRSHGLRRCSRPPRAQEERSTVTSLTTSETLRTVTFTSVRRETRKEVMWRLAASASSRSRTATRRSTSQAATGCHPRPARRGTATVRHEGGTDTTRAKLKGGSNASRKGKQRSSLI